MFRARLKVTVIPKIVLLLNCTWVTFDLAKQGGVGAWVRIQAMYTNVPLRISAE